MKSRYYKNIPGWINDVEADLLYNLSLNTDGPILEIGTLYGKSTSVICEAICDSFNKNIFDSCDINFKNKEEFTDFYEKIHGNVDIPSLLEEFSFSKNKNIFDVTIEYLNKYDLLQYVNLISENFHTLNFKYDLIYCDALHDINEININLPHMERISNKNCIWAIHDFNMICSYMPESINERKINMINVIDNIGVFKL
jgi:hypothetical protein